MFDHSDARLKLAESVIQSLQRLRPERGETHLALAQHYYYAYRDYNRARQELVLAYLTLPNEPRIPLLAGYIDRRQGRWEKSLEEITQALELNPRDFSVLEQIALTYEALGRYKDMASTLDRVLCYAPKDVPSRARRAVVDLESRADAKAFETTIDAILADDPNAALGWLILRGCWFYCANAIPVAPSTHCQIWVRADALMNSIPFPDGWCEGLAAWVHGDQSAARVAFENARKELTEKLHNQPDYAAALCALGVVDAILGNKEDCDSRGRTCSRVVAG